MEQRRTVLIGALPPPVGGAALANIATIDALKATGSEAVGINIASKTFVHNRGRGYHFDRFIKECRATIKAVWIGNKSSYLYLVPGGSLGMIYTLFHCIITGRAFGGIMIHHHSCKYIMTKNPLMARLVRHCGQQTPHIFLSAGMAAQFIELYGSVNYRVVTNARFAAHQTIVTERVSDGAIKLGHLSNLSREKGFFHVAAAFDEIRAAGIEGELILAGPVIQDEVGARLEELRAVHGDRIRHLGPVGPIQKDEFYRSIDLFLFPTQFAQEAAPLVLYEALSAGVPCLASDRGVIAEMLGGEIWDGKNSFGKYVLDFIAKNAWTSAAIADRAGELQSRMRAEAKISEQQFKEMVEMLTRPPNVTKSV